MKAIILAGGLGTRLYPATYVLSKQLLPVFDKPMIYYSLSTLMIAGIKDILLITSPDALKNYEHLLKNGHHLGLNIAYKIQPNPGGIPEAFILGESFIAKNNVALILGDNIFYGQGLNGIVQNAAKLTRGAHVFTYHVQDPKRYGIAEIDSNNNILSIEEKPLYPKSHYAITGLYFYDNQVVDIAKSLQPSERGELEITDINKYYLANNMLSISKLPQSVTWLDTGTHHSLLEASNFVATVENRQNLKIGCIEEVAYNMGFINSEELLQLAYPIRDSEYGKYLYNLVMTTGVFKK